MLSKIKSLWSFLQKKASQTRIERDFLPAVVEIVETPPSPIGRTILWTLLLIAVFGLGWSIFGHVDEVAIAPGKIIPTGFLKVVQAEDKGIIKTIHVKDGQKVKQGDLLIELNPTLTAADLTRMKKELAYCQLELERLMAEKQEVAFVPHPQENIEPKDLEFQLKLYQSRMTEYTTKLLSAQSTIQQNEASLEATKANQWKLQQQYEIAKDRENRVQQLVDQDALSTFTLLDYRSRRIELEQNITAQVSELARLNSVIIQSHHQLSTIIAERNRDIDEKIVADRKQVTAYTEELKKAQEKERYSRIIAPTDGIVTQLAVHTVGGVVTEAQSLLAIVPESGTIEVEAWAANKDIGFIQIGQPAEIKVETFSFQKFGTIDGIVTDISADAIEDKEKGRVYRVALKLDKTHVLVNSNQIPLAPGMSVSAEIKIRQKRIIEFFLDPFRQYQHEALRER